ncbi:hypothetical protein ZWY2020_012509 [Hordeum vulgare]|nr:hypothetical protein ZWY2020_012509 [Hordeum vulgare]
MDLSVTLALSSPTEHGEQLRRRQHSLSELIYSRDDDAKLETTRAWLLGVLKRHEDLKERLSRVGICSKKHFEKKTNYTLVTNGDISLEEILFSVIGHSDFDASPDLILTEDINGVNAGTQPIDAHGHDDSLAFMDQPTC